MVTLSGMENDDVHVGQALRLPYLGVEALVDDGAVLLLVVDDGAEEVEAESSVVVILVHGQKGVLPHTLLEAAVGLDGELGHDVDVVVPEHGLALHVLQEGLVVGDDVGEDCAVEYVVGFQGGLFCLVFHIGRTLHDGLEQGFD